MTALPESDERLADGTHEAITDDRLAHLAEHERRAYRKRLVEGHGYDDAHRRLLADLTVEERRHRNRDDRYWIASTEPAVALHAIVRSWDRADVVSALLLTDGAAALHDRYHLAPGWPPVLELAPSSMTAAATAAGGSGDAGCTSPTAAASSLSSARVGTAAAPPSVAATTAAGSGTPGFSASHARVRVATTAANRGSAIAADIMRDTSSAVECERAWNMPCGLAKRLCAMPNAAAARFISATKRAMGSSRPQLTHS